MYARVTTFHISPKSMSEVSKIYEESIIPAAKKQPGFKKAFFLTNDNAGKFVSVTIWESTELAIANQKTGYYQAQLDKLEDYNVVKPEVEGFRVGAMSI